MSPLVAASGPAVHDFLSRSASQYGERPALLEGQRTVGFGELDELASRFAALLTSRGVGRGDRVLLALPNGIAFVAAYFGGMRAGATVVPLQARVPRDRLAYCLADCAPVACVVDGTTASAAATAQLLAGVPLRLVSEQRRESREAATETAEVRFDLFEDALDAAAPVPPAVSVDPADLAAIIYTSGSTGEPRGVMLSHANICANTASIISYLGLTAADRALGLLPFHYVYGLSVLHTHMAVGGSIVIDGRFAFPKVIFDALASYQVTGFAGVPATFTLLLQREHLRDLDLPSLRYVTQAGGRMSPAQIEAWLQRGFQAPFFVMYGATEASARLTYLPPALLRAKLGSVGRPIPSVSIAVLRDDGSAALPGEVGEVVASGPNIARGYWNAPEESSRKFTAEGYRTGDLGYLDADGFLFLVGRRDDMIKTGGHRVAPSEIENVLTEHPAVREAAVLSMADELLGEVPVAFVVPSSSSSLQQQDLVAFCQGRLAPHAVPARMFVRTQLPSLSMGKVDRVALREQLLAEGSLVKSAGSRRR